MIFTEYEMFKKSNFLLFYVSFFGGWYEIFNENDEYGMDLLRRIIDLRSGCIDGLAVVVVVEGSAGSVLIEVVLVLHGLRMDRVRCVIASPRL